MSSFHQRKKQKSSPSSHPLTLPKMGCRMLHTKPRGSGVPHEQSTMVSGHMRELDSTQPICLSTAEESGW